MLPSLATLRNELPMITWRRCSISTTASRARSGDASVHNVKCGLVTSSQADPLCPCTAEIADPHAATATSTQHPNDNSLHLRMSPTYHVQSASSPDLVLHRAMRAVATVFQGCEVSCDPPIVHRRSIPWAGDRRRGDGERRIRRLDRRPAERSRRRRCRNRGDLATARVAETRAAICAELDREAVLVHEAMVQRTQQERIAQAGVAAICPVPDVVTLQEDAMRAAGERASSISPVQCTLEPARDRPPLAPHGQRRPMLVLDDLDYPRIAAESPRRIPRDERCAELADLHRICAFAIPVGLLQTSPWNRERDLDR